MLQDDPAAQPEAPRPEAWLYMSICSWYPHAEGQWRDLMHEVARREGFEIKREFADRSGRTTGLDLMWNSLRYHPEVKAIIAPDPTHFQLLPIFKGLSWPEIRDRSSRQMFVVNETFCSIIAPSMQALVAGESGSRAPARPRRRLPWQRAS